MEINIDHDQWFQTVDRKVSSFLIMRKKQKEKIEKKPSKQQLIQWYLYDNRTKNISIKSTKYDII